MLLSFFYVKASQTLPYYITLFLRSCAYQKARVECALVIVKEDKDDRRMFRDFSQCKRDIGFDSENIHIVAVNKTSVIDAVNRLGFQTRLVRMHKIADFKVSFHCFKHILNLQSTNVFVMLQLP